MSLYFSDLSRVKKRLGQEKYWARNQISSGLVEYAFSDGFEESQWVILGNKRGKKGGYILHVML